MAGVETDLLNAKTAAYGILDGALASYIQGDYTSENWTTLTGYKSAGDAAINAATTLAGVSDARDAAVSGMAGVATIAETLAAAKTATKADVEIALAGYSAGDYTPENWAILNSFHTDGDIAIDAAGDLTAVAAARTAAINGMDAVETIAETLAAAKVTAKADVATALSGYAEIDYTTENWTILNLFHTDGDTAIDGAADLAAVDTTKTTALNGMADVETIAETLSAAKEAALADLSDAFGTYIEGDYTGPNWITLTGLHTSGDSAIDAAGDLTAVGTAKDTATAGIADVATIAETLSAAKEAAKADVATALSGYTEGDYTADNWTALNLFHTDGDTAIDGAGDLTAVGTAKDTATAGIADVATIAETLAAAKEAAKADVATALSGYTEGDYTADNWTALNLFHTDGDTAIDGAADLAAVDTAKTTAINGIADVETIADTLSAAKEAAKADVATALSGYTEGDYTADNWTALNLFNTDGDTAIDGAADLAAVDTAKTTAIKGMAGVETIAQTLAAAKEAALADLSDAFGTYIEGDYTGPNWITLTGFHTSGDSAIDAAGDLAAVDTAKTTALNGMAGVATVAQTLADAKTTAKAALTVALGTYTEVNYTPANWTTLTGFKTAGDSVIDAAADLAAVDTAKTTALNGMAGVDARTLATAAEYAPTDTALINGSGFNANETYTLIISSTDEPPVNFEAQVTADGNGNFVYAYQLDGTYRPNYKVEVKDSNGTVVATTTFKDANRYAVATGDWSSTNTWSDTSGGAPGASVPVAGDAVTINSGVIVTVTATAAATSITINSTGTLNVANSLTVSGSTSVTGTLTISSATGTKAFNGDVTINSGGIWNIPRQM